MRKIGVLALLALAGLSVPAGAKVVSQGNGVFVTRDSAVVEADLRETWLKLIAPGEWWDDAHTWSGDAANMSVTPQGGGCFCERMPPEEDDGQIGLAGSVQHMVVINATPDRVLRMRGGLGPLQSEPVDGVLTIALSETDEGTLIVFEYVVGGFMRFETPVIAKAVDGVVSQQLGHLADALGRVDAPAEAVAREAEDAAKAVEDAVGDPDEPAEEPAETSEDSPKEADRETVDEAFEDIG